MERISNIMVKIISLYNNKGGVSKTTTTFNLAVYLSSILDKKILIVDCDPQCNITELFFSCSNIIDDPEKELPGTSIYQALLPRFRGDTARIDPEGIQLSEHEKNKNLYLFKGDLEFSRAETYLGTAWNQAITENIHEKNTYIAFNRLLESLGETYKFDYILCDVGPSTGAITRTVILSSHEILIPLIPDRFCYQAVKMLGNVISEWIITHQKISEHLTPFGIETFDGNPVLAGTILQNFKVHSGSRVKESYVKWQNKIAESIKAYLISTDSSQRKGLSIKSSFDPENPFTASIKDVAVLAPIAQLFGHAIFDIQQEHTKEASSNGQMYYGTVWEPWENRMNDYKEQMGKLAEAIR